jgi:hypothetical protein
MLRGSRKGSCRALESRIWDRGGDREKRDREKRDRGIEG